MGIIMTTASRSQSEDAANTAKPEVNQTTAEGASARINSPEASKNDTVTNQDPIANPNVTASDHQSPSTHAGTTGKEPAQNSHGQNSENSSSSKSSKKKLQERVKHLENQLIRQRKSLEQNISKLKDELATTKSSEQRVIGVLHQKSQEHAAELEKLQKIHDERYQQLQIVHARSIKEINGGIETITDEYITKSFMKLRYEISCWCRKNWGGLQKDFFQLASPTQEKFQKLGICLPEESVLCALGRIEILQGVVWKFIERRIFRQWLYGLQRKPDGELSQLEDLLHDSASVSPHTKPCEWRAYTISRLRNSSQLKAYQESLIDLNSKTVDEYLRGLCDPKVSGESRVESLKSIMRSAATLATELKTQRAEYSMDDSVHLKDTYDSLGMKDVLCKEEDAELERKEAKVVCIMSTGWVKKEDESSVIICKALVRAL